MSKEECSEKSRDMIRIFEDNNYVVVTRFPALCQFGMSDSFEEMFCNYGEWSPEKKWKTQDVMLMRKDSKYLARMRKWLVSLPEAERRARSQLGTYKMCAQNP